MPFTHFADGIATGVASGTGQQGRCQLENGRGPSLKGGVGRVVCGMEAGWREKPQIGRAGRRPEWQAVCQINPKWQKEPPCSPVGEQLP